MTPAETLAALSVHGAELVVNGDRIQMIVPEDQELPSGLLEAAKANRDGLRELLRGNPYAAVAAKLFEECPAYIERPVWEEAVADAQAFLEKWGAQAKALGWTSADLFGLHTPPSNPRPNYQRLARHDATGLVWLLDGRAVVALTAGRATIQTRSGGGVLYRKLNKPALGPAGDSLDDFVS